MLTGFKSRVLLISSTILSTSLDAEGLGFRVFSYFFSFYFFLLLGVSNRLPSAQDFVSNRPLVSPLYRGSLVYSYFSFLSLFLTYEVIHLFKSVKFLPSPKSR